MNATWIAKRSAKWFVEWAGKLSGAGLLYRNSAYFRTGARILTYHDVEKVPGNSHAVSISHFSAHIQYLKDHFDVMRLLDLVRSLQSGSDEATQRIAITFDDGYAECSEIIAEILTKYSLPATFFVITGIPDGNVRMDEKKYMSWSDIADLHKAGFEIGSHTVNHFSLGAIASGLVRSELCASRERIQQELGTAPTGIAYPYGTMRDFNDTVTTAAESAGYSYGVTAVHGLNHPGMNPFLLRRTTIGAGDGPTTFKMILEGHLDWWRFVDRYAYRLQRADVRG
jgi:peptidoglycan/xylan/chitin deacetylase (PgdA/CDA1 family)